MTLNFSCGLKFFWPEKRDWIFAGFNKLLTFCLTSVNYLLDLIFERDEFLKQIDRMNFEEIYFLLKGEGFRIGDVRRFPILECPAHFNNFGHDLGGANFHIFSYHDERIKTMIWQLKFNENKRVARIFGYCLARNLYESKIRSRQLREFFEQDCLLVPTPIHSKRFFQRGYNQCHWLCREIVQNFLKTGSVNFKNRIVYNSKILKRVKYTEKQSWTKSVSRSESILIRNKKIEGVFKVNKRMLARYKNYNIILIDDVFTTGATIKEAAKTLKMAGVKRVWGFCLARTIK